MADGTVITKGDRDAAIAAAVALLEQGKSLREIAEGIGVAHTTVRAWLLADGPKEYEQLKARALIARIAESDQKLEEATSYLEAQKWRDLGKFARWDAERRLPHLFAVRHEISGPNGAPLELDDLERARRLAFLMASTGHALTSSRLSTDCGPELLGHVSPRHADPSNA